MSIADKAQLILECKSDIKDAIEAKGVSVGDAAFDQYASKINAIPTPIEEAPESDVNFYDYTGFRVASYTIAEAKALTALPTPPQHEGLTFQEWNWSLSDIQTYDRQYIDVGANYITTDGKTHMFAKMGTGETLNFVLKVAVTGTTMIDFGDGTTENITNGQKSISHTYLYEGDYEIKISVSNYESSDSIIVWDNNLQPNIYKILLGYPFSVVGAHFTGIQSIRTGSFYGAAYVTSKQTNIPKGSYDMVATNMFFQSKGRISFPKQVNKAFSGARFIMGASYSKIVLPDVVDKVNSALGQCSILYADIISIPNIPMSAVTNNNYFGSAYLYDIDIVQGWVPSYGMLLNGSSRWTADTMVKFFTKLGTTSTAITLTFGTTNLNKLTAEQKQIATNKGYTLA